MNAVLQEQLRDAEKKNQDLAHKELERQLAEKEAASLAEAMEQKVQQQREVSAMAALAEESESEALRQAKQLTDQTATIAALQKSLVETKLALRKARGTLGRSRDDNLKLVHEIASARVWTGNTRAEVVRQIQRAFAPNAPGQNPQTWCAAGVGVRKKKGQDPLVFDLKFVDEEALKEMTLEQVCDLMKEATSELAEAFAQWEDEVTTVLLEWEKFVRDRADAARAPAEPLEEVFQKK
eukprot:CAMPEP_0206219828 /NCGR_PEP_ID=MMETSP0047_2-20121206/4524_1 /ASSEMBLY_ACC=CAM_ASM_000192 /TAXON_ID=195065 /ORGANISM="Chroomonas mesostigmatica_cf, Strain CCMP1168" /LENGTH=237 /DNA_ID=CAMNT_0053642391 /DNA_START=205 /DNA_END=915 /DNA_ORIENTATION=-